jgi:hypothetical protein
MDRLAAKRSRSPFLLIVLSCLFTPGGDAGAQGEDVAPFLISAAYRDLDGDLDMFPDTGETGRVQITIKNRASSLGDTTFFLTSADPDVVCLIEWSVKVPEVAAHQELTVGSLDTAEPGFAFRTSEALQTLNPASPARIDLCLNVRAARPEFFHRQLFCFNLLADLDLPAGVSQSFVAGPDGVFDPDGTSDDGQLFEGFDIDRNADGIFSVSDAFHSRTCVGGGSRHLSLCAGDTDCVDPVTLAAGTCSGSHSGFYLRGSPTGVGTTVMTGLPCGEPVISNQGAVCLLDPDFPMDWHYHCPPTATNCPNAESVCVGPGCSYRTPAANDPSRHGGINSLHWGAHFDLTDGALGDTTHFRQLSAFVTSPINLAVLQNNSPPGNTNPNQSLEMSFFHIADLMDNNGVNVPSGQCADCADVQVRVDQNPDPAVDAWGTWDKLVPFLNVYDHVAVTPEIFGGVYCRFTPTDTGTAPPAPRGVHETMCFPQGLWSHCGSVRGTALAATVDCLNPPAGTEALDLGGTGVWVQSKFNLASFLGQRIQVRWIGGSWRFFPNTESYYEIGGGWGSTQADDGWWIDSLKFTGAITTQTPPDPDSADPPPAACPADLCADGDRDGFGSPGSPPCPAGSPLDCDDADPRTYPGAPEVNDARDNQCPGSIGHGVIDEVSGALGVAMSGISWRPQEGSTAYQVARSDRPDFSGGCVSFQTSYASIADLEVPPEGSAFFYLIRATSPNLGSWGQDSSGREIIGICGL